MKATALLILALLIVQTSYSQTNPMPNGLDGGIKSSSKSNDEDKDTEKDNSPEFDNLVGFSLGHLGRNLAVVSFERNFTNRFSARVSAGFGYGQDVFKSLTSSLKEASKTTDSVLRLDKVYSSGEYKLGPNYYFDITGKVFTNSFEASTMWGNSEYLGRFYGGLSYRNNRETYLIQSLFPSAFSNQNLAIVNHGMSLNLGFEATAISGITTEYYIGIGQQTSSYPKYKLDPTTTYYYLPTNDKTNESSMLILVGCIVGLSF